MTDWQDISSAPRDGEYVDLWDSMFGCRIPDCYWSKIREKWKDDNGIIYDDGTANFTHWMYPPDPPDSKE